MNDRIRELAKQARQEFLQLPTGYTAEQVGMYPQLMEKFAELIVRECAGLCSTHEMADEPFGEKSYRKGRHFNVMIRQHFGVE